MFQTIISWFVQLWGLLSTPLFTAYGLTISMADIALGAMVTCFVISVFWKGAKA